MPLLDDRGRLLGKFNLFDFFVVVLLAALVVIAYRGLTVAHRVAPPYALDENRVTVAASLQLPADQAWMCEFAQPGTAEIDPRTGDARAEVLGCAIEDGMPVITLRIHAVRDATGKILFEGTPLLCGRELQLETASAILEGVVRRVAPEAR